MKHIKVDLTRWITGQYRKIIYPFVVITTLVAVAVPMGIPATAATAGANDARTGADVSGIGTVTWSNPGNITTSGSATASVGSGATTHYLRGTNYGFSIPTGATINGIAVTINRQSSGMSSPFLRDSVVSLVKAGTIVGSNLAVTGTNWPTSYLGTATYGGISSLWGTTWSPEDINNVNFGVVLSATNSNDYSRNATVDYMRITVTYTPDTTAPTVTNVTSSLSNGTYGASQLVPVQVTFSEPVTVSGTPRLTLSTGSPATTAVDYSSGSSTNILTFNYTVAAGNYSPDLDYAATTSLTLNGGTIKDVAGNNATLTLAVPGAAGSLGANKNIVIATNYTLVANNDGQGTVSLTPPGGTYASGTTVTLTPNPASGYSFNNWSGTNSSDVINTSGVYTIVMNGNKTVQANFDVNSYTISFDSNGGSAVASITQDFGTSVTAPANPTKEGYTFASWSPAVPSTMPASDTACVAQWTIKQYTISFDSNGGSAVASITQDFGTSVTAPANPTKEGYTFASWNPAVPTTMPASNTNCVAQWSLIPLVFNTGLNGDGSPLDGSLEDGFVIETANLHSMHVLALNDPTANPELEDGDYAFTLQADSDQRAALVSYFAAKAGWTDEMKTRINEEINGSEPFFYLHAEGGVYSLVDCFKKSFGSPDTSLTIDDDYPAGIYEYTGTLTASNGATLEVTVKLEVAPNNLVFNTGLTSDGVPLPGSLATQFTIAIANSNTMHKLELDGPKANPNLKDGDYAFILNADSDQQDALVDYFAAKAGWTDEMKARINAEIDGSQPFFYLHAAGGVYTLVDSFKLHFGSPDTSLTIDDDYLAGTYEYNGTLVGTNDANLAITVKLVVPAVSYTITFDSNGGTDVDSITAEYRAPLTAPDDPTRLGYTFDGWDPDFPATMPLNGANLVAQWTQDNYSVTYDPGTQGTFAALVTNNLHYDDDTPAAPATSHNPGYTFTGWNPALTAKVTGTVTYTAQWSQDSYSVTYDPGTQGTFAAQVTNGLHYDDATPAAPATSHNPGYGFAGWSPALTATVTGTVTYTAQWSQDEYTLTINIEGSGSVVKAPDHATYHYNDVVGLTATPDPGWTFDGFSGDTTTNSITMTGNKVVTATFTQNTKLVIISSPKTINAGAVTDMIKVQLQDSLGNPVTLTKSVVINLATTSSGGSFAINSNGLPVIDHISLFAGQNSTVFYYKDTDGSGNPSTPTITVSNPDLGSDSQKVTVNAPPAAANKIVFISVPTSLKAGKVSSLITIQIQDANGNPVKMSKATVVTLSSTSGGVFATNSNGLPVIGTVTINTGSSKASFYYKNGSVGAATITVSCTVGADTLTKDANITITP
jgi:hypothetical protein